MRFVIVCVVLSVAIGTFVEAGSTTQRPNSTLSTTTQNIKDVCAALATCGDCVQNHECLWCENPQKCEAESSLFSRVCSTKDTRRLTCTVSYRTMLIAIGVVAGVVGLAITIACCFCCCRRSKQSQKNRLTRDNICQEREEEERRTKHAARRAERQNKYDEIRQKYELLSEVKCLTDSMKKDLENERGPPSLSMAQGDAPATVDFSDHHGVMAGETTPMDATSAAILLPPPPPVVRRRAKLAATRMPIQSLSKTHSLVMCPYHHASVGGAAHLSPFEARLRRRAREERRRREEREHQLELLADMARMIAGNDGLYQHCVECRPLSSTTSMPATQGRLYRGTSSNFAMPVYNCKECRRKKY